MKNTHLYQRNKFSIEVWAKFEDRMCLHSPQYNDETDLYSIFWKELKFHSTTIMVRLIFIILFMFFFIFSICFIALKNEVVMQPPSFPPLPPRLMEWFYLNFLNIISLCSVIKLKGRENLIIISCCPCMMGALDCNWQCYVSIRCSSSESVCRISCKKKTSFKPLQTNQYCGWSDWSVVFH